MNEVDRRIDIYQRLGWCPVPYAHHPKEIRDALRRIGMRPQMKQCFRNCQRFMVYVDWLEVEYHEGWIMSIIPIKHAWLKWDGQIIDLTLNKNEKDLEYLNSTTYTVTEIRKSVFRTGVWGPVDEYKLSEIGPYADLYKQMRARDETKSARTSSG